MARITYTEAQLKAMGLSFTESGQQPSVEQTTSPKSNKKVLNATLVEQDKVIYASKLELFTYNLLTALKIDFKFQVEYELMPKFIYNGQPIRSAKIIVDFFVPAVDWLIDSKGFQVAKNKLQIKLLKHKFFIEGKITEIHLPSTKEEVEALCNKILTLTKTP